VFQVLSCDLANRSAASKNPHRQATISLTTETFTSPSCIYRALVAGSPCVKTASLLLYSTQSLVTAKSRRALASRTCVPLRFVLDLALFGHCRAISCCLLFTRSDAWFMATVLSIAPPLECSAVILSGGGSRPWLDGSALSIIFMHWWVYAF